MMCYIQRIEKYAVKLQVEFLPICVYEITIYRSKYDKKYIWHAIDLNVERQEYDLNKVIEKLYNYKCKRMKISFI